MKLSNVSIRSTPFAIYNGSTVRTARRLLKPTPHLNPLRRSTTTNINDK